MPARMPRYDIRNDGAGPYAIFYCDRCNREYRSQPDVGKTITNDIGRNIFGGFLRSVPLVGDAVADGVVGQDPRYINTLTPPQLEAAWKQVGQYFKECPKCHQLVCMSDFDSQAGFCNDDSPRRAEIARAQGEQAAGMLKGVASVFGIGDALTKAAAAAKKAQEMAARCPQDGTLAKPGTKFCPNCGTAMLQPESMAGIAVKCSNCGADTKGAKFCPECGTKVEAVPVPVASTNCQSCGAALKGAKFCPECGVKVA